MPYLAALLGSEEFGATAHPNDRRCDEHPPLPEQLQTEANHFTILVMLSIAGRIVSDSNQRNIPGRTIAIAVDYLERFRYSLSPLPLLQHKLVTGVVA